MGLFRRPPQSPQTQRVRNVAPPSAYKSLILGTSGLVAYWRLGETDGSTLIDDAIGPNNLGIGAGAPDFGQSGAIVNDTDTAVSVDSSNYISGTGTTLPTTATNWSLEVWVFGNPTGNGTGGSPTGGGQIVGWGTGAVAGSSRHLIKFNNHIYFWGEVHDLDSGDSFPASRWNHIVITCNGAGLLTIYLNGASIGSSSPALTSTSNQNVLIANNRGSAGVGAITAIIDEVAIYNVALDLATVQAHYNLGSGADPQTVSPAAASILVTGQTPTIVHGTVLAPAAAAIAITGQTSTIAISDHQVVSPTVASIAVTGQTPTIIVGVTVSPVAATVTITGQTSTVVTPVTVSPTVASIVITTGVFDPDVFDPDVFYTVPRVIVGTVFAPAAATITITGQTPTIALSDHQTIDPDAATVTITGQTSTVTVSDHQSVSPAAASIAVTGQTSTVTASDNKSVSPDAASVAITGQTSTVTTTAHQTVSPVAATVAITGNVPFVSVGDAVVVSPAPASVTVTASTPTVAVSDHQTVSPAAATVAVTGQTPTIVTPVTVAPSTITVTITGQVPTVFATDPQVVAPGTVVIAITGQTPTVTSAPAIPPLPKGAHVSSIVIAAALSGSGPFDPDIFDPDIFDTGGGVAGAHVSSIDVPGRRVSVAVGSYSAEVD